MVETKKPIGSILLKHGAVSSQQLADALGKQRPGDLPLVSQLVRDGVIDEHAALKALSEQTGCPGIDLSQVVIRTEDLKLVPRELAERYCVLPVLVKGNRMFVAMANPTDERVLHELEMVTGKKSFPYVSLKGMLREVISEAYELRGEGHGHFVGIKCSPETLHKAGVSDLPAPSSRGRWSGAPVDEAPSSLLERRLRPSTATPSRPVILDDTMTRASRGASGAGGGIDAPTYGDLEVAADVAASAYPASQPAPGARTMFVVDADEEIRRMVASVFTARGYRVVQVDRGDTALGMVRAQSPDVIVLDATLPQVHGFEVARQLKSSDRYRHTKIVMTSSLYRGWRIAEDLKANYGVDGFIEKPFSASDIVHAVDVATKQTDPSQPPPLSLEVEGYLQRGIAAYKQGRLDEAIGLLQHGIDADPLAYKVHFHLGLLYGKRGQLYDGIQELETALSLRSQFFPALKNLAVLYQNAGFRNKAIEMWERCLAAAPDEETRENIKRMLLAVL